MNLLYSNYLEGSYVGYVNNVLADYRTTGSAGIASYFADLQPNTTYTLKKYSNTSRFRVATFYTDVKNSTGQIFSVVQWWLADSYDTITFTTGSSDIHLVVYYTNSSQYNAQIMLNEGSEAEPYSSPTKSFIYTPWTGVEGEYPSNGVYPAPDFESPYPDSEWRIEVGYNNGYPYHKLLRDAPSDFQPPWPDAEWRIEIGYNNGYPYHKLLRDVPYVPPAPSPPGPSPAPPPIDEPIHITINDIKNADAGNSYSNGNWVKPWYNIDNKTYEQIRGKDAIIPVLNSNEESQYTRYPIDDDIIFYEKE